MRLLLLALYTMTSVFFAISIRSFLETFFGSYSCFDYNWLRWCLKSHKRQKIRNVERSRIGRRMCRV